MIKLQNNDNYSMKIYYNTVAKRCQILPSFRELAKLINYSFTEIDILENYNIIYKDDEDDSILIESEYDYQNALLYLNHSQIFLLKIYIIKKFDTSLVLENSLWKNPQICDFEFININNDDTLKEVKIIYESDTQPNINSFLQITNKILNKKIFDQFFIKYHNLIKNKRLICPYCNRKFHEKSYNKHLTVCFNKISKRSPFNSKKQRILNIEHFNIIKQNIISQIHENIISPIINPFYFLVKKSDSLPWSNNSKTFLIRKLN
jgi:hypothetical protein